MEFLDFDRKTVLTGEVWSPGPVARSVWVLLPDGRQAAVKFPSAKCPRHHRISWTERQAALALQSQTHRLAAQSAPPLGAKAWRSVLDPALCP